MPYAWLRFHDEIKRRFEKVATRDDALQLARECGMTAKDMELCLAVMHEMSLVLWHNEPGMRDHIVLVRCV